MNAKIRGFNLKSGLCQFARCHLCSLYQSTVIFTITSTSQTTSHPTNHYIPIHPTHPATLLCTKYLCLLAPSPHTHSHRLRSLFFYLPLLLLIAALTHHLPLLTFYLYSSSLLPARLTLAFHLTFL